MNRRVAAALLAVALASTAPAALADDAPDGGVGVAPPPGDGGVGVAPPPGDGGTDVEAGQFSRVVPSPVEDEDLGLIPSELHEVPGQTRPAPAPSPTRAGRSFFEKKLFFEDAFTLASPARAVPVPYPGQPPGWQNRTSFDVYLRAELRRSLTITLGNRLNVIEQEGLAFLSRHTARNDFREGYVTWEVAASTYLEAGRVNVRNGAALGFNPTDFFKTGSLVGQASLDPSALRQNRLGTLLARAQEIWDGGSASIAYAPRVQDPAPVVRDDRWGIDPSFDATNGDHRALAALGLDLGEWSPQLLAYYEAHRSKLGFNLSRSIGDAVIAYAEWAGGWEQNLIARAFGYAQATSTLLPGATPLPPTDTATALRNDLAAGASWTIASKITLNFEYHFHQAGLDREDWRRWFDLGSSPANPVAVPGQLWYLRGYAADQQEPSTRHQLFVRAAWPRAVTSRLELSGFALVNLYDGSTLAQVLASFYPSDLWTIALYGSLAVGAARSERGSLPQWGSLVLQVVRYR